MRPLNHKPQAMSAKFKRAYTMVEMMVTMAIFSLAILGVFYAHIFGLKQDRLISSKLGASDQSRRGFDILTRDIRSAKIWAIGNGTATTFTPISNGQLQKGTAIQLSLTIDTSKYIIYYFNTNARELRRRVSDASSTTLVANYLTNGMFFQAEQFNGQPQYDLSHKGVINCSMEFAQYQYPLTRVGSGYLYDYYKMSFKVTPHVPDGP